MRLDLYLEKHPEIKKISEANLRVKVIGTELKSKFDKPSYKNKYVGCYGTLERSIAGVRLDGKTNNASGYGLFWFHRRELEVIEDNNKTEENKMALSGNYKVAVVKFDNGCNNYGCNKEYNFALYPTEYGVNEGDYVLVDNGSYDVAKVIRIVDKGTTTYPTKEVICKLDFDNYNARKKAREDKKKLKAKMDAMLKESQELLLYQAIADKSPEMAKMLEEFKSLGDV